jgi:CHAD domain-containing protein
MELTLVFEHADAARLQSLPIVKAARTGRPRGQAVRIVWHDALDRALAVRGLALAEQRGAWRLERTMPAPVEPWPPATDHRLLEEAPRKEALSHALPDALSPVAAFEGRRTVATLIIEGETVSMAVLDGVLRAVAAERPATRLILDGPDAAVRTLLSSVAEAARLMVPPNGLAVEALSLADGTAPMARRSGAPALSAGETSVHAAFVHIAGHLTDVILRLAPLVADASSGPEPVHQMRVAVRRARSALTLFPAVVDADALARAAAGLRQLGRMLGPARDWDVFMTETAPPVEAALPGRPVLTALLRAGERRRRAARLALGAWLNGAEFRLLSLELACLAAGKPAAETPPNEMPPLREFAAGVLRARLKKLLKTGKSLEDLDNPGLHDLRLKAKRLRYAAEFFAPLFPERSTARFVRRLSVLQDRLGVFNDTTVAEALLRDVHGKPGNAAGLVVGFTAARGAAVRPEIAAAWARFRQRDPFWE